MQIVRIISLCVSMAVAPVWGKQLVVVIDPAGDAKTLGRQLDDAFERGITLQCAQAIEKRMSMLNPNITIVLTRMPGESIADLQNAQLTNQLSADLYVSLNFYHEHGLVPGWYIYILDYAESYILKPHDYVFYYYDQVHLLSHDASKACATKAHDFLKKSNYSNQYTLHPVVVTPFKSLVGIASPALAFDIGLKSKESWKLLIDPLCYSIINMLSVGSEAHA